MSTWTGVEEQAAAAVVAAPTNLHQWLSAHSCETHSGVLGEQQAGQQAAAPDLPLSGANISESIINVYGNSHPKLYADMIQAVNTGKPPLVSAADGKRAMDVALAIYKSQRDGKPVAFPASDLDTRYMLDYRWQNESEIK